MNKQYISRKGLQEVKEELEDLKKNERKKVLAQLAQAKSYGDLSENAEYSEMKDRKRQLDSRIRKLERIIKDAVITDDECGNRDEVSIGCTVQFKLSDNGKEEPQKYQIVGVTEADPMEGKISNESPIGKAFLGKKIGQEVVAETPSGTHHYVIIGIN